jgi:NADH-quinone oxidoreductase subunit M
VPLTNGFPAELLMLLGTVQSFPALSLVILFTAVISAAYVLGFVRRGLFGPVGQQSVARLQDLRPRELGLLITPALLVLALGMYPQCLLSQQEATLIVWLQRLQPSTTVQFAEVKSAPNDDIPISNLPDLPYKIKLKLTD